MPHTVEWKVRLHLFEDQGTTKARVVLDTGATTLTGRGVAHCNPADVYVSELGDELAAGRAMRDLAQQLVDAVQREIEGLGVAGTGSRTRQVAGWSM